MRAGATPIRELVEIDERRLLRRLDDLSQRGALQSGGIYRALYTPAWSSAMDLVAAWLKEAGILVRRDAVGNLWGRIEGHCKNYRSPIRTDLSRIRQYLQTEAVNVAGPTGYTPIYP